MLATSKQAAGADSTDESLAAYADAANFQNNGALALAIDAWNQFLRDYPAGKYAANAHYWLGELYLVVDPQDLESSRQSFMLLVTEYPDNAKVPDALYKLGKVHYLKGNRDKARQYLDGVIKGYGDTSAARLAREFIAENY